MPVVFASCWQLTTTGNSPSIHFNDVVQFTELVRLDDLVIWVGQPFAVDDEAIAVAALVQGQPHAPLAGAAGGLHWGADGRPVVEVAGDQDLLGVAELHAED